MLEISIEKLSSHSTGCKAISVTSAVANPTHYR